MRPLHRLAREAAQSASAESIRDALRAALEELYAPAMLRVLEVSQDRATATEPMERLRFDEHRSSGTARVVATRRPLVVPDALTSTEIVPGRAALHGIASALFLPVTWGDEVRAVVILGWRERREVGHEEVASGLFAADQAAAGLARLEAEARTVAGSVQDRAVVRAGRALNATLDLQEILLTLVHEAALALEADFSGVYLGNGEDGAVAAAGYGVPEGWHGIRLRSGEGIVGQVLATGETSVSHDYERDYGDQEETGDAVGWLWQFVGGRPKKNQWRAQGDVPATTGESDAMSRALKTRGFTFVGSTICYSFMQATGMVNDHIQTCFRYRRL